MIRVVADTNVLISAILFGGLPETFLNLAFAGSLLLVTSPTLLDELEEKLLNKFQQLPADVTLTRSRLEHVSDVVSTVETLSIVKDDPDDDRVLECAVAGRANYIVSGDRHLLKLGSYDGIQILTIRQFIDKIEPAS